MLILIKHLIPVLPMHYKDAEVKAFKAKQTSVHHAYLAQVDVFLDKDPERNIKSALVFQLLELGVPSDVALQVVKNKINNYVGKN